MAGAGALWLSFLVPFAPANALVKSGATLQDSAEPVLRDCGSSVYGSLGEWQPDSILAGPLGFVRARAYERSRSPYLRSVGNGRYEGLKLLTVVQTGWKARIVVPPHLRSRVALIQDPASFNLPVVPSQGVHDVTLTACPPGQPLLGPKAQAWTQFNGEIVVAGRRCVSLYVYAAKQGDQLPSRPVQVRLAFGTSCPR